MSETRVPYIIRLTMSKPPSSRPSQCEEDGEANTSPTRSCSP